MSDLPAVRVSIPADVTALIASQGAAPARKRSGAGRPRQGLLANTTRTNATPSQTGRNAPESTPDTPGARHERRTKAFQLQDRAARLLGDDHRVCQCGKIAAYDGGRQKRKARMEIKRNAEGIAYASGLMRCGSVWACPVCASRIAQGRRDELANAAARHVERIGHLYMLTLTVRHAHDDLAHALTDQLLAAYNKMTTGRWAFSRMFKPWTETVTRQKDGYRWKEVIERDATVENVGYMGQVRALECTHGQNGWHPHLHVLLFVEDAFTGTVNPETGRVTGAAWDAIFARWSDACEKVGLDAPDPEASMLQDGTHAAKYISKWGAADELTRAHTKKARKAGKTPWQLLEVATLLGNTAKGQRAGHLFREFVTAFTGRRQLYWTPGLRDALNLGEELDDQVLAEMQTDENHWDVADSAADEVLASISWESWELVRRYRERADLLHTAEVGGASAVKRFIRFLRVRYAQEFAGEVWKGAA